MERHEKRLLALFDRLASKEREMLLAFAEFLADRASRGRTGNEPLPVPRPTEESVIAAIRRLRATYPMLPPGQLMDQASACLARHSLENQPAAEAIDELETLFADAYQRFRAAL